MFTGSRKYSACKKSETCQNNFQLRKITALHKFVSIVIKHILPPFSPIIIFADITLHIFRFSYFLGQSHTCLQDPKKICLEKNLRLVKQNSGFAKLSGLVKDCRKRHFCRECLRVIAVMRILSYIFWSSVFLRRASDPWHGEY